MKILIFSEVCFIDNIFPLFRSMKENGYDVTCLINLSRLNTTIFNINKRIGTQSIVKATDYPEVRVYNKYMDLEHVYFVNHAVTRKYPWREWKRTFDVYQFIKKGDFDIIHTDMQMQGTYKYIYKFFGKKMVFVQHDPVEHSGMEWSVQTKKMFRYIHKYVSKFAILNPQYLEEFCNVNNISKDRVLVNALGPLDCIGLYKNSNIKERKYNVLFFGRIVKYKGIEYLCQAMEKVHEQIPEATVTIAGSGKFYFDISKYNKLPYFEIHNRFIGIEELAHLLQECSISICYYTDATQSGGVLTSFTMNRPVIASNIEAMRMTVKNGYNGVLVKPCDATALAESIVDLLCNGEKRNMLSRNIENDFLYGDNSWSVIVEKYIEFYKH